MECRRILPLTANPRSTSATSILPLALTACCTMSVEKEFNISLSKIRVKLTEKNHFAKNFNIFHGKDKMKNLK